MTNWLKFAKLTDTAIEPKYQTIGAAGMDLHADADIVIPIGETRVIGTGIAIELSGCTFAQILPRSGLSRRGVVVAVGTIDADYRGELGIIVTNLAHSGSDFHVKAGDRIAQLVIQPVIQAVLYEPGELSETERGGNGFGSTGVK